MPSSGLYLSVSESKNWNKKFTDRGKKNQNWLLQLILSKGAGNCIFRRDSLHTWFALLSFSVSFQQWHTSTAHGDGHIALRVGMTTPDTRADSPQYDRWHIHWGASETVTFLPVRSGQASFTQTIRLWKITRVSRWIMGDSWTNNNEKVLFFLQINRQDFKSYIIGEVKTQPNWIKDIKWINVTLFFSIV